MSPFLFVFAEIVLLFVTSRMVTKALFSFVTGLTRSIKTASWVVALLFLLGTIIHELAHFLMATVLFVPTGEIELLPEIHADGLKLGSVQVAKSDIVRRLCIGFAPLLIGVTIVSLITYFILPVLQAFAFSVSYVLLAAAYIYVVFVIANTMFSSKKDTEGALGVGIVLLFIVVVLVVAGKSEWILDSLRLITSEPHAVSVTQLLSKLLVIPVAINILIVTGMKFLKKH